MIHCSSCACQITEKRRKTTLMTRAKIITFLTAFIRPVHERVHGMSFVGRMNKFTMRTQIRSVPVTSPTPNPCRRSQRSGREKQYLPVSARYDHYRPTTFVIMFRYGLCSSIRIYMVRLLMMLQLWRSTAKVSGIPQMIQSELNGVENRERRRRCPKGCTYSLNSSVSPSY